MLKMIVIAALGFVLLIPLMLIYSVISERESRQNEALRSISESWSHAQNLSGPFLVIPYEIESFNLHGDFTGLKTYRIIVSPEKMDISGDMKIEIRSRGIFEGTVYRALLDIKGNFQCPDFDAMGIAREDILWSNVSLIMGISDTRGIENEFIFNVDKYKVEAQPGVAPIQFIESGVSANIANTENLQEIPFNFNLRMRGSQKISFAPSAKYTNVQLRSNWPDPSFFGAFLPLSHDISNEGFSANWEVYYLGRDFASYWNTRDVNSEQISTKLNRSYFGAYLTDAVSPYHKVTRSVKYGILFVVFTFVLFFIFEMSHKFRIHPIQYISVGSALVVFYLLLLSMSEHIGFNLAYLAGSIATILLISLYSRNLLKPAGKIWILGLSLGCLYLYLFIVLQLEDFALLAGSVGVFALLAAFMYWTRHTDWYALHSKNTSQSKSIKAEKQSV